MTDYPYDPDLPFVVVQVQSDDESKFPVGSINARFRDELSAREYAAEFLEGYVEFVDTTPAPKIPADAEFIFWVDPEYFGAPTDFYARKMGSEWIRDTGERESQEELEGGIGDAEVVVLKRA